MPKFIQTGLSYMILSNSYETIDELLYEIRFDVKLKNT
jgi:hypothetical protein